MGVCAMAKVGQVAASYGRGINHNCTVSAHRFRGEPPGVPVCKSGIAYRLTLGSKIFICTPCPIVFLDIGGF